MTTRILTLPGYQNSGPVHWQSLWEKKYPMVTRVLQNDWDAPKYSDWYETLIRTIQSESSKVVLVAHSLGCLLTAGLVREADQSILSQINGALLVAPPDPDGENFPDHIQEFSPRLTKAMPFPSIVVASNDDPYASLIYAQSCAEHWGSRFVNLGHRGHINANSELGDWPQAWEWVTEWL